ncbi:G-protein coupled receptor 54-like [Acipenser oxyrinchus oxyrinchus]|uniref:G-protein coupled receptor 54-like n=1 Tax=Acipenser oxyrinchus oxyrinchus TaxID=40147 RepID=A0AAD8CLN0_ACIOX|nr:G-protein coupled receptor 54-like [Acipenser oxyrinchus oxyrinchus]
MDLTTSRMDLTTSPIDDTDFSSRMGAEVWTQEVGSGMGVSPSGLWLASGADIGPDSESHTTPISNQGLGTKLWIYNVTDEETPPFLTDAWLVPLFFALIMLVGLVGNSLVIYVITKHKQMRTATNFYIGNLATTDILFLVCCVPFTATLYPLPSWIFGEFMCKFVNYLQQVTVQATCITLTAMSVDRCYATLYPLQSLRRRTPRVAMAVSVGIWIGSCILSLPMALYHRIEVGLWYGLRTYCIEKFPTEAQQKVYILYSFLAVYLLPLITICVCYTIMLKRVGRPVVEPIDNNYQPVPQPSERSLVLRARVTRMVVAIVLLFSVCWGPIQLFLLVQGFYRGFQANYETYKIKTWANCMSYANSALNPIVYSFMGESFRKSFKKAFPFMFRRRIRDGTLASGSRNHGDMKFDTEGT